MQIETELDKNRYIVLSNDINDYVIKEVIEKILEISDYDARMSEIYNNYNNNNISNQSCVLNFQLMLNHQEFERA